MPDPNDYDDHDEFIDDCMDEGGDEESCETQWAERSGEKRLVYKARTSTSDGTEFVMSDETVDLYGEVISANGWELGDFKRNPAALFGHNSAFVIGRWENVRIEKGALIGKLVLAQEGTSDRINEVIRLVRQGILKAVSVGFKPIKREPMDEKADEFFGPFKYLKQKLVECSLVSIPANPNALSVAKSLRVSDKTMRLVFAKNGNTNGTQRNGEHAETSSHRRHRNMSSLAQRIVDSQKRLVEKKERLAAHIESSDDNNVSDADLETRKQLNDGIGQEERTLASLQESERHLAASSDGGSREMIVARSTEVARSTTALTQSQRPFSMGPRKALTPIDLFIRTGVINVIAHRERKTFEQVRQDIEQYRDEPTRMMLDVVTKAATAPAMTTVTGWAAELVQTLFSSFMESLHPKTIFPRLSAQGLTLTFGRNGKISIPTRALTPTVAGSFVGEGQPIPVRQAAFTAQILTPKKMAVITTWTREIDEHSVPAIEGLLRDAITVDTGASLDAVLMDANPATLVRPAGILNGVAALPATAGGGFAALVGDIKQISGALLTGTKGNVRNPVWLMNPQQIMSAGLTAAPGVGAFPFKDEINQGRLMGWSIIDSGTVPLGRVIAMDAADFVAVGGEAPRFELSDQATLHFEDTTPADIVSGAAPGTAATPVKSLWQTDSIGLRLILPTNWTIRRPGVVSWVDGVTW
jgi:HK97 family phage prohead protease/HK97 family phage major capsid protein